MARTFNGSTRHREISRLGGLASHPTKLRLGSYDLLGEHNQFLAHLRYARALIHMSTIFDYTDIKELLTRRQWSRCKHSPLVIHMGHGIYKRNEYEIDQIFLKQND